MKKLILVISLSLIIMTGGLVPVVAQEEPAPKKDTVNMDTEAKPTFYYSVEDEQTENTSGNSSSGTIAIIIGAVIVVVGAIVVFVIKKRNK